jgi:hypothetical protein
MANVEGLRSVGKSLVELVYALENGVDIGDLGAAQALVGKLLAVAGDIKDDADSALLEIGGGLLAGLAEKRRGPDEDDGE